MILIEYPEIFSTKPAVRGFVNTFFSWEKSDSGEKINSQNQIEYTLGERDLRILKNVTEKESEADILKTFMVAAEITAPLYWWQEFSNYSVTSIHNKYHLLDHLLKQPIKLEDFSYERLMTADDLVPFKNYYKDQAVYQSAIKVLKFTITALNKYRDFYLKTRIPGYKDQLLQLLPVSYNQKRLIIIDYYTLRKIHKEQRHDSSAEWIQFCIWSEDLPYAKELIK